MPDGADRRLSVHDCLRVGGADIWWRRRVVHPAGRAVNGGGVSAAAVGRLPLRVYPRRRSTRNRAAQKHHRCIGPSGHPTHALAVRWMCGARARCAALGLPWASRRDVLRGVQCHHSKLRTPPQKHPSTDDWKSPQILEANKRQKPLPEKQVEAFLPAGERPIGARG
jgi:hypothetical protein